MAIKKSELYSSLWKSCDELRGGMDASQYKDFVLVLLFVKYISDRAAAQRDYLLTVPTGGGFADMVAAKGNKEIGDRINKIIARLAEANENLKGAIDLADFLETRVGEHLRNMQQLLSGQTRLPGFGGEWEEVELGDIASFHKCKGLPKSAISEYGADLCIHYGELFTKYPETIGTIFSRTDMRDGTFRSMANDVLMPTSDVTPRGLAKASCIPTSGVILGGDILVIRANAARVDGTYLSYAIRRDENQVLQLVSGTTVFHLYGSDMKRFKFRLPKIEEQKAIVAFLADIDTELAALEARRDKTRALKQGMMQALLTGRIRLPVEAAT